VVCVQVKNLVQFYIQVVPLDFPLYLYPLIRIDGVVVGIVVGVLILSFRTTFVLVSVL
jgi:hypothetical protein